jgi:beta-lactamase class C
VTIPNSGWNAPLDDLATYLAFLTGTSDRPAVLARKTLEEMWRPILPTGATLPELGQVGLGFFSAEVDGRRIVGHTGDQAGYRSFVYFDPERRTGLVMVFNTTNDAAPGRARLQGLARAGIALLR